MVTVFDTNTYRTLVSQLSSKDALQKISEIKALEKAKGLRALMSTTVAMELISHLYDNDTFYQEGDCTKAVRALYAHCGDNISYGVVPLPNVQISRDFFMKEDKTGTATQDTVAQICYALYENPTSETASNFKHQILSIKTHIEDVEKSTADYLNETAKELRKSKGDKDKNIKILCDMHIGALLTGIAEKNGIKVENKNSLADIKAQFSDLFDIYYKQYRAPLKMIENIGMKMFDSRYIPTKPKRLNQIWDQQILHVASQTINNDPIILVSSDKEMIQASRESATGTSDTTPFKGNVATREEYLTWLQS